jgi:ABC-type spermidine/putrescine transport system permease subunit I
MNVRGATRFLLAAPAVSMIAVFLIVPLLGMIEMSFRTSGVNAPYGEGHTFAQYGRFFQDGFYLGVLAQTLIGAAVVTLLCLLVSYPLAWHLSRATGSKALLLYACIASPLMTGVLVRNFGWMILVALNGPLNQSLLGLGIIGRPLRLMFTQTIVIIALVHVFVPFMVLPINNALRNISPTLLEASASMGASRRATFWKIIFPLSFPGVQSGVILVFILSVAAYVTPALLGGQLVQRMSTLIVQELTSTFAWPFGSTLALMMSASTLLVVVGFTLTTVRLMDRVKA